MLLKKILKNRKFINFHRNFSNRNVLKLKERGMIQDIFPENAANSITDILNERPRTVYAGFDPTADSLHLGNLLVLINLLHWQRGGHQPIALVGGATAKIGDPSGRKTERDEMHKNSIENNIKGIYRNIQTIFENHEKYLWKDQSLLKPVKIVNNDQWYSQISAVELIGKIGRNLRMGTLLSRHSVQTRLNSSQGMSFTEFSYQLFQAYDWAFLFKNHDCSFQIGGNDQMGNIMSGQELISKLYEKQVYGKTLILLRIIIGNCESLGLTVPLVTTEMGDKFGKSAGNAVWLSSDQTSPFTLYQFFVRQPDSEVEKLLKLFTFKSLGFISDLLNKHNNKPELRIAQEALAEQVTLLVHGVEGLEKAKKASEVLYKGDIDALGCMNVSDAIEMFDGATVVDILPEAGQSILDLAMQAGCFSSKHDALRIISAGGFSINQRKATNPSEIVSLNAHVLQNKISLLKVGKRHYYIIRWLL